MSRIASTLRAAASRATGAVRALSASGLARSLGVESVRAAQVSPDRPEAGRRGTSGTPGLGGYSIGRDYKWSGLAQWAQEAEKMLRTDPKLAGADMLLRHVLLSARWHWEPPADCPPGERALAAALADYANQAFGLHGESCRMAQPWEAQLARIVRWPAVGCRYLEEVYRVEDGHVWLDEYADCDPAAHLQWVFDTDGVLSGVVQNYTSTPKTSQAPIPASKLLLLTLNRSGANIEGVGMLRPCWWWWQLKMTTGDHIGYGLERWALPVPQMRLNRAAAEDIYDPSEVQAQIDEMSAAFEEFAAGRTKWLRATPVVEADTFGGEVSISGPGDVVRLADQQMLAAYTQQFADLGVGDVGSKSVGQIHESNFRRTAVNLLDQVAHAVGGPAGPGRGTMGRLIGWNFGAVPRRALPRLVHTGLEVDALVDAIGSLPNLVAAGLITPDDHLEELIRQRIGAGLMPESSRREQGDRLAVPNNAVEPIGTDPRAGRPSAMSQRGGRELVLVCGLPGAGKTTRAKMLADGDEAAVRLSRDDLGGSARDKGGALATAVKAAFADGRRRVYVDGVFGTPEDRAPMVALARVCLASIRAEVLTTDIGRAQMYAAMRQVRRYGRLLTAAEYGEKPYRDDPTNWPPAALFARAKTWTAPDQSEGFETVATWAPAPASLADEPACYLFDLDGTLRTSADGAKWPTSPEHVRVCPERAEVVRRLVDAGAVVVCVTNQSWAAGREDDLRAIDDETRRQLGVDVPILTATDPAGPPRSWWRKPCPGMAALVVVEHGVDPADCLVVGSTATGQTFAKRAGMRFEWASDYFGGDL